MSRYLRPRVAGATVFFTVALADRTSDRLVREVAALREAVRATRAERWFGIDAWGEARPENRPVDGFQRQTREAPDVLPDHMHCVWTLPEGGCGVCRADRRDQGAVYHGRP